MTEIFYFHHMLYFNYNGKTLEENSNIIGANNRALRYGDGLFETIKYKNNQLVLIDEHFSRLWKGMQSLQFQQPKLFTPDLLQHETMQLLNKNKLSAARVRITVIRGDGGLYDAKNHLPNYLIQSWPLPENNGLLNENGLQICIYKEAKKSIDTFSQLKHNNFLPYFMGALYAKKQLCNDAVILNCVDRVADTTIANLFIIKNGIILTPSTDEGCIAGVMRKQIIQELIKSGYTVSETQITEAVLMEAEEVFLTNSIYNIQWVGGIANKKFDNKEIKKIYENLKQTNPSVFC